MPTKTTPSQRLTTLREALGVNHAKFAESLGVHHMTVRRWESGDVALSRKNALKIAAIHNASVDWLLTGKGEMLTRQRVPFDENTRVSITPYLGPGDKMIIVPILSAVPCAGNGNAIENYFDDVVGGVPFSEMWIRKVVGVSPDTLCVLEVSGDSMTPTLTSNEMALVDISAPRTIFKEGVWVLRIDDQLCVKRVHREGHGKYQAISDNPKYPPITLDGSAQLMGKVVGSVKRF